MRCAKGKQVDLSIGVLCILHELSEKYKFNVRELTDASHSTGSQHYSGTAVDINIIGGKHIDYINYNEDFYMNFTKMVKEMRALQFFYPYRSAKKNNIERIQKF